MIFAGWIVANILMPIVLPIIGMVVLIPLLGRLPSPPRNLDVMTVVKDGQLCWAVIGMGTAASYEVWEASQAHHAVPEWGGLAQIGLWLMMLPAMVVAAVGAVLTTPLMPPAAVTPENKVIAWLAHYVVFVGSLLMAAIVAALYAGLHFSMSGSG